MSFQHLKAAEPILLVSGLKIPNDGDRTVRPFALELDDLRIERGGIVFVLGMQKAGKTALRDAMQSIFRADLFEGENLTIPQEASGKPPIRIARLWRAAGVRYHSQSGKAEHVPGADENVFLYCDDPNEGGPTGPAIIDLVLERRLTMVIGTDPDRLAGTLRHFLTKGAGRILWLHHGLKFFEGNTAEFRARKHDLCAKVSPAQNSSDANFLAAVGQTTLPGTKTE